MISLDLPDLAAVLGVDPGGLPRQEFSGVSIDSRQSCDGRLFVAIRGENFDAHDFVAAAAAQGAIAALVDTPQPVDLPQLVVDDTLSAMARIANHWRHHCSARIVALTGSSGKTTVKEMLYRILSAQSPTLATRGNLNNEIGVPLTLFELDAGHEFAIIEMGANHRGEIARLAEIAEPDIVYVNNAGLAHVEGFGGLQGVIEGKGELYAYCGPQHTALFNLDDPACEQWQARCAAQTRLGCALDAEADVGADWRATAFGIAIDFRYRGEQAGAELALIGEHNARNALAAVSLALLAGVDFADAVAALDGFAGIGGRLQFAAGPSGSRLLDDTYNANPDSLEAGMRAVLSLPGEAWLALGDMRELGDDAEELHRRAGSQARELGLARLYAHGELSCLASEAFGDRGYCCADIDDMASRIIAEIHAGVNLLVKGSRAAAMERLVERLAQPGEGTGTDAI
jgi:UDP-N-acetylmuramoyl-tripeptide--D-alanyl-D-alanine ligase